MPASGSGGGVIGPPRPPGGGGGEGTAKGRQANHRCQQPRSRAHAFGSLSRRERAGVRVRRNDDSQTTAANDHAPECTPFAQRHDRCRAEALAALARRAAGWPEVPAPAPDPTLHRRLLLRSRETDRGTRRIAAQRTGGCGEKPLSRSKRLENPEILGQRRAARNRSKYRRAWECNREQRSEDGREGKEGGR